jgi:DNA-directed RNA polymerase
LFERNFKSTSFFTKETASLMINQDYIEDIKNNIIVHPNTLPMISKPNLWSDNSFGGFLDNSNKEVSLITGSSHHNHLVENKTGLYKAINYLNSIKFSVNNLLLDYLNNEGNDLLNKIEASNDLQRIITLKIAESFKNVPFYLNVNADWRGRIYTQSFFLTYQGGDLSSALINF